MTNREEKMTKEEILLKLERLIIEVEKLERKSNKPNQFGSVLTDELFTLQREIICKNFN